MSARDDLAALSSAEDFFTYLDLPYDRAVLDVARLHILRRMGDALARAPLEGLDDADVRARLRELLASAYADFVTSTPLRERVFKVLRQAVVPAGVLRPGRRP